MARIITEMYPLRDVEEPPGDISHVVSEESEDSMAEEKEKSMFGKCVCLCVWDGGEYEFMIGNVSEIKYKSMFDCEYEIRLR